MELVFLGCADLQNLLRSLRDEMKLQINTEQVKNLNFNFILSPGGRSRKISGGGNFASVDNFTNVHRAHKNNGQNC